MIVRLSVELSTRCAGVALDWKMISFLPGVRGYRRESLAAYHDEARMINFINSSHLPFPLRFH